MADRLIQRTAEFRTALSEIESVQPFDFDDTILRDRMTLSGGLLLKNAFYTRDQSSQLGSAPFSEIEFEPSPNKSQGSTDSLHGVIFGNLHTYNDSIPVAVKPYDNGKAAAVREHVAYEFMKNEGFESFTPLGVVSSNQKAFLVTAIEPSLKTFDNMRWSPRALKEGDMGEEQVKLLGMAGKELGQMHAQGITHGDSQPKNVAVSERGKVGFIDLETMRYDPDGIGTEPMGRRVNDDLLNFYGKLRRWYGYCRDEGPRSRFNQFDSHFLQPYTQTYQENVVNQDPKVMKTGEFVLRTNIMKYVLTED